MFVLCIFMFYIPISLMTEFSLRILMTPTVFNISLVTLFLDMLFNFNSGYYYKGFYHNQRWEVILHYIQNELSLDFFVLIITIFAERIWDILLLIFFVKIIPI
jgi:hypothetical protein